MSKNEMERNIVLYKWFFVLVEPLFVGPTLILYLERVAKMSLSHIYIMEAVVIALAVIMEIPSGALADLIGRKKTMVLGAFSMLICKILLSIATSSLYVWISNIFWVTSISMISGANFAFLYDSLKELDRKNEWEATQGKAFSYMFLTSAFCFLSVGFLSEISLRLPFLLSIPGILASCFIALFFKETGRTERYNGRKQQELMKLSFLFVKNHKKIKWIVGFSVLILVSSKIWFFSYNPYFELVGFNLKYYGIVFFFFNIIAWYFSRNAYLLKRKIKEKSCVVSIVVLMAIPIILMGTFVSKLMISMTFVQNIVRGFIKPFTGGLLNHHIKDSSKRATILSIESAVSGFVSFFALSLFGLSLKIWSLVFSLKILGVLVLIIGSFLIIQYKRIFQEKNLP